MENRRSRLTGLFSSIELKLILMLFLTELAKVAESFAKGFLGLSDMLI